MGRYNLVSMLQLADFIFYKHKSMSFANQYIQKYGERAIEAYKRSLNHADNTQSPRLQPKHITHRSKSSKSITVKSKKKHSASKSMLYANQTKGKSTGLGHAFNNIHLNLGINNPQRKKLIISEINTPKNNTPNKAHILPKGRPESKIPGAISTNVNVYVQAVNHSKSKESTPGRGLHNSREHSAQKKHQSENQLIKQITMLIEEEQNKRQSKNLKLVKQKLNQLSKIAQSRERQYEKMENRFAKMRQIVGKANCIEHSSHEREKQIDERYQELQNQLAKYKEKEKTLLRIVESFCVPKEGHRWKENQQGEHPISSDQQK